MTPFASVDVTAVAAWLASIPFEAWPQQRLDELRPAMVTDLGWRGFREIASPIVAELMPRFPGCSPFQHMLSAVMPGHRIESHRDEQAPYWVCRVHVPLMSNPDARFITCGVAHHLETGFAYDVDTRDDHAVVNDGETPRVHFMFDVRRER